MTTHYMEEADQLCDRIAIIDHGRIVALDTPAALKRTIRAEQVVRLEIGLADHLEFRASHCSNDSAPSRRSRGPTAPTARSR